MENAETRLIQRYFRKTKAHPGGAVVHLPSCRFFSIQICTCALLLDLKTLDPVKTQELYPLMDIELADQERILESLERNRNGKKS